MTNNRDAFSRLAAPGESGAAHIYRLAQARKLLHVFEEVHGRPVASMKELEHWVGSAKGKADLAPHHTPEGKIIP